MNIEWLSFIECARKRLTPRIRRRRTQEIADTTDAIRAVACIRSVLCHGFLWAAIVSTMAAGLVVNVPAFPFSTKAFQFV